MFYKIPYRKSARFSPTTLALRNAVIRSFEFFLPLQDSHLKLEFYMVKNIIKILFCPHFKHIFVCTLRGFIKIKLKNDFTILMSTQTKTYKYCAKKSFPFLTTQANT